MIKKPEVFKKLEDSLFKTGEKLSYGRAIKLFTYMWDEGVKLGVLPPKDPLEGIEVDIKIAKVLNSCSRNSSQG